jgi:uncharacterized protein YacL
VTKQRSQPRAVSALCVFVGFACGLFILIGVVSAFAPQLFRNNLLTTSVDQIPSQLELVAAISCLILGLVGIWLIQELRNGSQTALLLVQTLATINIIFSFFRLPFGLFFMVFNVVALRLTRTATVKKWVSQQ